MNNILETTLQIKDKNIIWDDGTDPKKWEFNKNTLGLPVSGIQPETGSPIFVGFFTKINIGGILSRFFSLKISSEIRLPCFESIFPPKPYYRRNI